MAIDLAVEFNKMRKQNYAFSHSWDLVIPCDRVWKQIESYLVSAGQSKVKQNPWDGVPGIAWGKRKGIKDITTTHWSYHKEGDNLNLRCKSSTIPKSNVRTERVKIYGMSTNVVLEDVPEGSITLVFMEDANHELYRFFSAWKDLGASHRTYASVLRKDISMDEVQLRLLAPDAADKDKTNIGDIIKLTFNLFGVQPTKVELSNLSNEINFMALTVTLKYDCFEVI
jgi:hypothetical protein